VKELANGIINQNTQVRMLDNIFRPGTARDQHFWEISGPKRVRARHVGAVTGLYTQTY